MLGFILGPPSACKSESNCKTQLSVDMCFVGLGV